MSTRISQPDNVAMKGGYWLATKGTMDVIAAAAPLVMDALDCMDTEAADSPFCLTDMGCADGGSSMHLVRKVVQTVRRGSPDREISVVYTDQPRNNYNALFRLLHSVDESSVQSYFEEFQRLYVLASGTSFYEQLVPNRSLDFGFSCTAMHWLHSKPSDISEHVHAVGATGDELLTFKRQAAVDWETILLHRAAELKDGGRLVLVNFCRDAEGRHLGNTTGVNMFDTFNQLWCSMLSEGEITQAEYVSMTLPQYYNTLEEFGAPFEDSGSAVSRAGLTLEHAQTKVVECPFRAEFAQHGDAAQFARDYVPTLRSWSESTFHGALSASRSEEDRRRLVDDFYGAYRALVEDNPAQHRMDYVHAYLTIAKSSS
jgi:hypothetical protein